MLNKRQPLSVQRSAVDVRTRELERQIKKLEARCALLEKNQKSSRDPLTGTWTREFFEAAVKKILCPHTRRAVDESQHLAIVYIDLDHFKLINDTYGHAAGDEVLHVFGCIAGKYLRGKDMVCRWYEGDEFMILLPGVDRRTVPKVIEKLRKEFEGAVFSFSGVSKEYVRPSFSFGYVLHRPGESLNEMAERADRELRKSKLERKASRFVS
jgi:diguanylate cyclase (GGDEF)-like protein